MKMYLAGDLMVKNKNRLKCEMYYEFGLLAYWPNENHHTKINKFTAVNNFVMTGQAINQ